MTDHVRRVQRAYPQLYLACHVEHTTRRRAHGLSDRDGSVLAHLDELAPVAAGALARHLGVGPSSVTAAIDRLEALGLVERTRVGRRAMLRITRAGVRHMQAGSVLDTARVEAMLAAVPAARRDEAVRGIELLAAAARAMMRKRANRRA
ncbi:MAG TPA: MarR family transcriptional regulator [Kofleriaceae bacterium]|nr:MarR family transcriptional regulator [Kofleriaceae bacterium]